YRERLRHQGREGRWPPADHRHPHLLDGLPVLDLQAGRVLEDARVRPELPAAQAVRRAGLTAPARSASAALMSRVSNFALLTASRHGGAGARAALAAKPLTLP